MFARQLRYLPLGSTKNGTSLTQIYFATHLHDFLVRDFIPRISLIKTKKESLFLNHRSLSTCVSNGLERYTISTQHRDFSGKSVYCWNDRTFAQSSLPKSTAAISAGSLRQYSSIGETVRENIAPTYMGYFKMFYNSPPVEFVQNTLLHLHSYTGLPWWATIILSTLIARMTMTLPLSMYQHFIQAKLQNLKYDMEPISYRIRKEADYGVNYLQWTRPYAKSFYTRSMKKEWKKLVVKENCHPMKNVVISIMQIPVYACLTIATMNLCYMLPESTPLAYRTFQELTTGGFGWISNLVTPDPYFLLPVTSLVTALTFIEIRYLLNRDRNHLQKYFTYFARTCVLIIVPLTSFLPSGVYLLWLTSNVYTLFETLLLLSPRVRSIARIPETDTDLEHPYATLRESFKNRFKIKKSASSSSEL